MMFDYKPCTGGMGRDDDFLLPSFRLRDEDEPPPIIAVRHFIMSTWIRREILHLLLCQ